MFFFIAGHSWGSASWIFKMLKDVGIYTAPNQLSVIFAWCLVLGYFVLIATLATYCLRIYLGQPEFELFKGRPLEKIKRD
jgi:hypothetical protein